MRAPARPTAPARRAPGGRPPRRAPRRPRAAAETAPEYDAVIVGAGMGGLTVASQLAAAGKRAVVLESYTIPGGSAGHFARGGYVFDVGASMMFGLGDKGTTNLITRALAAVGESVDTVPDPTQIHYHLPRSPAHPVGLEVKVWRDYGAFVDELASKFPAERAGIEKFYGECWKVFDSLNALDLKSLEEPRYLLGGVWSRGLCGVGVEVESVVTVEKDCLGTIMHSCFFSKFACPLPHPLSPTTEFAKHPLACLTLASFLTTNAGDVARRHIKDEELLHFIDIECFCWSTVLAADTPMINAGMVFCDRHYGGINYPVGGTGVLAEKLAAGAVKRGATIEYGARATAIVTDPATGRATGVRTADGRLFRGKAVVSNATRWDTFQRLLPAASMPDAERQFLARYTKAPSFLSLHMGVDAGVLPPGTECHHIVVDDWASMEAARGTLFVSIPTLLDPSLAPAGRHVVHAFTPDWVDAWAGLDPPAYAAAKEAAADAVVDRLEALFPGIRAGTRVREVGTPRTHRRFLNRADGTYGPIPSRTPAGMLGMPMNTTAVPGLYCVGDSTFPGQGVNAVVFSGFGCAHRLLADAGDRPTIPGLDGAFRAALDFARGSV